MALRVPWEDGAVCGGGGGGDKTLCSSLTGALPLFAVLSGAAFMAFGAGFFFPVLALVFVLGLGDLLMIFPQNMSNPMFATDYQESHWQETLRAVKKIRRLS